MLIKMSFARTLSLRFHVRCHISARCLSQTFAHRVTDKQIDHRPHTDNNVVLEYETFAPHTDDPKLFSTVPTVNVKTLHTYLQDKLKLQFTHTSNDSQSPTTTHGIQLLHNIASEYDYWLVRRNQELFLYYRIELMLQRLNYMKSMGMDERQKLAQLRKFPPALVMSLTNSTYHGKLIYVRGLVRKDDGGFMTTFYPMSEHVTSDQVVTEERVGMVEDELDVKAREALREVLSIPCFFMHPALLHTTPYAITHLRNTPQFYDVDKHTLQVLPPICNLKALGIRRDRHLRYASATEDVASLPTYNNVLDVTYPTHNGAGTPECLSTFLFRADMEEDKDRTGGQKLMKPRKGFNVKPRQY